MTKPEPSAPESKATAPRRGQRTLRLVLVFIGVVICVDALVGEKGLLAMRKARQDYRALETSLSAAKTQNARLREEARRLREDPRAVEDLARRELGLIKPGEKLFIVRDVPPRRREIAGVTSASAGDTLGLCRKLGPVPFRFDPDIAQMRAALRGRTGPSLLATLEQQLANLRVAALAADDSARYIAANALAEQLTGYPAHEITQLSLEDITPLPSTVDARTLWRDFVAGGTQRGEFELRTRSGGRVMVRYWAYATVAPGIHVSLLVRVDRA